MRDFNSNRSRGGNRSFGGKRFGGRDSREVTMHDAVCAECGKDCQVPFRPSGDKPVLCSQCFRPERSSDRPSRFSDRRSGGDRFQEKRNFPAVCDQCGKDCEVPFRPTQGKPIFCSDCFEGSSRQHTSSRANPGVTQEQFDALNAKVDQILQILAPELP